MDGERHEAELAGRVQEALAKSPRLNAANLNVRVEARGERVVLSGTVKTLGEKRRAELLAKAVPGVGAVENRLELDVYPRRSDAEIQRGVEDALMQDRYLSQNALKVEVSGGKVRLTGRVPTLVRRRLAGALAWWVPGVSDVVNEIEVTPPEQDSDEQITEGCVAVLEKDPLVDAGQVFVWTQGGVVKLSGAVKGEAERESAENDVWGVEGVREVLNDLRVSPERS